METPTKTSSLSLVVRKIAGGRVARWGVQCPEHGLFEQRSRSKNEAGLVAQVHGREEHQGESVVIRSPR